MSLKVLETGWYYLKSRYYDPEVGRFLNADGKISGVGGDIRGYNLYEYCFNNPVNMDDSDGNWPKWIKEIGARAKYLGKFMLGIIVSPFKALKVEAGIGTGIGVKGSANIKGIGIEVGASSAITDVFSYDKGKFDIKNTTSKKIGITICEQIDVSYSRIKEHSYFDETCHCDFLTVPFVEKSKCLANVENVQKDMTIGFSAGLYCFIGGEVFAGIDLRAWYNEMKTVLSEPYISLYY